MTKALVTGANGHVGANLCRELLARDYEVVPFVRKTSSLVGLEPLKLKYKYGDVFDAESLKKAAKGCDVMFHTAAVYAMGGVTLKDVLPPALEGTRNALAAARDAKIKRVVMTSSIISVGFPKKKGEKFTEENWNEDRGVPYGVAKVESEREAHRLAKEYGIELVVVLPAAILGAYDYGITPSTKYIIHMLNGDATTGLGTVNYADVGDVARGHVLAMEKGRPGERYLLTGEYFDQRDLAKVMKEIGGKRVPWVPAPRPLSLASAYVLENVPRLLGKEPVVNLDFARTTMCRHLDYDTSKSEKELGYTYKSARETLQISSSWVCHLGKVNPKVAERVLAKYPPDPAWG